MNCFPTGLNCEMENFMSMKSGFVGIVGRPNVGKSTLLNRIIGEKIAITSNKPQTTRNSIRGIYTTDAVQIVFIDTPGIHKGRNKLGNIMSEISANTLKEVDLILFLVDGEMSKGGGESYILELIGKVQTPAILAINKIDSMTPQEYMNIYTQYSDTGMFAEIYGVSAMDGTNVDKLLDSIKIYMEDGPMYFPEDMITDYPERFLVSEIIREKLLMYLDEEVPHGVAVEIESFEEGADITRIGAVIYCEKKSHKGIIIGRQGKKLKGVGKSARIELEALLGTKIFLEIFVKVKEGWRNRDFDLKNFGYKEST